MAVQKTKRAKVDALYNSFGPDQTMSREEFRREYERLADPKLMHRDAMRIVVGNAVERLQRGTS